MINLNQQDTSILDIDKVETYSENDRPLFDELFKILKKYDATNRFGVSLLHKHFNIAKRRGSNLSNLFQSII
jgi:hypothetical protein